MNKVISFKGITKLYPPNTVALDNVDIDIECGSVTSIIGENGAGKSTLMKILYGIENPNSGTILIDGNVVNIESPKDSLKYGIGMLHQEFMLVHSYTICENIVLGEEPKSYFDKFDKNEANRIVSDLFSKYKIDLNPEEKVSNISIAAQQKVEIAKLLYKNVETLILDEPTAPLTPQESKMLFDQIKFLKKNGHTIIFISHKLDEILDISDNIAIMRKGKLVEVLENKNIDKKYLATKMIGRPLVFSIDKKNTERKEICLNIEKLTAKKNDRGIDDISFNIKYGEIVGIAGIEGNGQLELVQAIIGQIKTSSGKISIKNIDITNKKIHERRKLISYISQDRKHISSVQNLSLLENGMMTHHKNNKQLESKIPFFINYKKSLQFVESISKRFQVVKKDIKEAMSSLSGGNQQKLIIAREFTLENDFIILDQPTRGLDIQSIEYIHKEIINKRDNGSSILLVSAELEEILSISDRIIILYKGKIVGEKHTKETTVTELGEYMLGLKS